MPITANCPSCGAGLSEASVIALAPVCSHCGAVITRIGGTLGLTSAYGVSDPSITRRRVEADLGVLREYRKKYLEMIEACKEQLEWNVASYAKLPDRPELLKLGKVPPLSDGIKLGLMCGIVLWACLALPTLMLSILLIGIRGFINLYITIVVGWGFSLWLYTRDHFKAKAANGDMPRENARREKAYLEGVRAALKAAEPVKMAHDHRLRCQIRELEGLAETMAEKEAQVRWILANL